MKKILFILLLFVSCSVLSQGNYDNNGEYVDTLITSRSCYLYNTPQVTSNTIDLIKVEEGTMFLSKDFHSNYYCIEYEGSSKYIFCLDVITPTRVRKEQLMLEYNWLKK